MAKDGKFKCSVQGCNYSTDKEGYLRKHVQCAHEGKGFGSNSRTETKKKVETVPDNKCSCGGKLRLLNRNDSEERRIMEEYQVSKVCMTCDEMY